MTVHRIRLACSRDAAKAVRAPGRRLAAVAAAAALGSGVWLAGAPAASAATSHCLIINNAINTSYTSLQAAVNAAASGATLWVRGTCAGTATISTSLTITGQQPAGFTAATLNGGGQGPVLDIEINSLTVPGVILNNLTVTGGNGDEGGGIFAVGHLTLNNVTVAGNTAVLGGGIGVEPANPIGSTVTLNNSTVRGNTAQLGGGMFIASGGIPVPPAPVVTLNNSTITGNTAESPPFGGGVFNDGTLVLNGTSSVTGNTPDDVSG
jgi:hypothetical protein